jgi:hypothetical protein
MLEETRNSQVKMGSEAMCLYIYVADLRVSGSFMTVLQQQKATRRSFLSRLISGSTFIAVKTDRGTKI